MHKQGQQKGNKEAQQGQRRRSATTRDDNDDGGGDDGDGSDDGDGDGDNSNNRGAFIITSATRPSVQQPQYKARQQRGEAIGGGGSRVW